MYIYNYMHTYDMQDEIYQTCLNNFMMPICLMIFVGLSQLTLQAPMLPSFSVSGRCGADKISVTWELPIWIGADPRRQLAFFTCSWSRVMKILMPCKSTLVGPAEKRRAKHRNFEISLAAKSAIQIQHVSLFSEKCI